MKIKIFIFFSIYISFISSLLFCPESNNPPQNIEIDESYTINPVKYNNEDYTAIQVGNKIFLNRYNGKITSSVSGLYTDSQFCPTGFVIPKKEDLESVIKQLGSNAYSVLTDPNGFNMEINSYYLTNTKGQGVFNKIFMYLEGKNIKFLDSTPNDINGNLNQKVVCRCMLDLSGIKMEFPEIISDIELNTETLIKTNSKNLNGYLWRVEDSIFNTETIKYTFSKSGIHLVEFWGHYINGEDVYLCENVFVKRNPISNTQNFDDNSIKLISTDFQMIYNSQLHFIHSNCPVAPRIDGGYYIAFTDTDKFLHVLSYDKDNSLLNNFNTTEKAYPHDITSTDYGFAIYMIEADSSYHSYLSIYNKNFDLVNTAQIMNNNENDNKEEDSNLEKQIIRYNNEGNPVFGMRFMYRPDNGKLIYSRGRIFLIFAHYNHFIDDGGHTGDTIVTFNDVLTDMDFGQTWGSSHSLIQSATFDEYYFWTAALGDAYPQGIKVEYTSKRDFTSSYDSVNEKYNERSNSANDNLAGNIKGYLNGSADGKLGGILYFANLALYCLIYAKTPDPTSNKNTIYMTTWEFDNNIIQNEETTKVKEFESDSGNVMQVRAGKYGNDKVFIIYTETTSSGGNHYGSVNKGTNPKLTIIQLPNKNFIKTDEEKDNLFMNTNEDLRTFEDGVLIWATSNTEGKLIINKIGTPGLDTSNDDIDYILTKNDIVYTSKRKDNGQKEEEKDSGLSPGAKAGIALGVIGGVAVISVGVFFLLKYLKAKNLISQASSSNIGGSASVYSKNNLDKN